jgi:hypothetical protein
MGQSVVCESHTKTRNLLQKFRSALRRCAEKLSNHPPANHARPEVKENEV